MEIKEEHKRLLIRMGLKEEDFVHFDGKYVSYEFEPGKGVRIYDPFYATSYNEYIGIDGWSAWSEERDTFMSSLLNGARKETRRRETASPWSDQKDISEALNQKFSGKTKSRED